MSRRSLMAWTLAGAAAGATAFLATAIYVIYGEVNYRCESERCHTLEYAIRAVLDYAPGFGASAVLLGSLAGLAAGLSASWLRKRQGLRARAE